MDIDTEIEDVDEETTHDDEWKLQHLDQLDNEEQLNLILREINHIMWHNERFHYINTYASINWSDLSSRFDNKDEYINETAAHILELIGDLVEERGVKREFNLAKYYRAILNIKELWAYYKDSYMGDESDTNIVDLIEGLKFL